MAADMVYRLEFGLMSGSDIEPPWDDIVISAKAGLEARRANPGAAAGKSGGAVPRVRIGSETECRGAITAAQERMRQRGSDNSGG